MNIIKVISIGISLRHARFVLNWILLVQNHHKEYSRFGVILGYKIQVLTCPDPSACRKKALYRTDRTFVIEWYWIPLKLKRGNTFETCYFHSNSPAGGLSPTETCRRHRCIKHSINKRKAVDILLECGMITPKRKGPLSPSFINL
jgi:hypothetical protein